MHLSCLGRASDDEDVPFLSESSPLRGSSSHLARSASINPVSAHGHLDSIGSSSGGFSCASRGTARERGGEGGREGSPRCWCSPAVGAAYRTRASAAAAAGRTGRDAGVGQGRVGEYGGWNPMDGARARVYFRERMQTESKRYGGFRPPCLVAVLRAYPARCPVGPALSFVQAPVLSGRAFFADTPLRHVVPPTLQPHAQMRSTVER
ncbi:hypothetical protein B0H14DRAFT_2883630 [Mycena olivaceomarginata]|nr:hypothetical protein B0H14DRAFT_2883630 [Mycena olivaceomarginata]